MDEPSPSPSRYVASHVLQGHTSPITVLKFNSDGTLLASCGEEHIIKIWSTATGELVSTLAEDTGSGPITDVAWLSDADGLALASAPAHLRGIIRIWDIKTGTGHQVLKGNPVPILCLTYNQRTNLLVSGCADGDLFIWDLSTGELRVIHAHMGPVNAIHLSRTAIKLISCSADGTIRIWETFSGRCVRNLEQLCHHVQFSPNTKYFISSSSLTNSIQLWQCRTLECLRTFTDTTESRNGSDHRGHIPACFSGPEGRRIVATSGSQDHICIWDAQTESVIQVLDQPGVVTALSTHLAKGMVAAGSTDLMIRLWVDDSQSEKDQLREVTWRMSGCSLGD